MSGPVLYSTVKRSCREVLTDPESWSPVPCFSVFSLFFGGGGRGSVQLSFASHTAINS